MNIPDVIKNCTDPNFSLNCESLYYYTTMNTFINNIIKKDEFVLWAGHVDYMKDKMEFEIGMKIIRKLYNNHKIDKAYPLTIENGIKESFPFQLSFSRAFDCYPMWKIYGHDELAVMLELDYKQIKKAYNFVMKCIYKDSKDYKAVMKFLRGNTWFNNKEEIWHFSQIFPFLVKDKHYSYEKEVRIFWQSRKNNGEFKYSVVGNLVKPFKELHFSKDTLKGIVVGPCSKEQFELNLEALSRKLSECGFINPNDPDSFNRNNITQSTILIRS